MNTFDWIVPEWPAPPRVKTLITTRSGGHSPSPYDSLNLGTHVGDKASHVEQNRDRLLRELKGCSDIQWLEQVHSSRIVDAKADGWVRTADASYTSQVGIACAVLTADCLPLLICDQQGTEVAAVHGGWKGLAGGVIRSAISRFSASPNDLLVYLGPAIGPDHFEVGIDVVEAMYDSALNTDHLENITKAFKPGNRPMKMMADIYELARAELIALGVSEIYGGNYCTFSDLRFYSYRRDNVTGRMASLIYLDQ